MVRLAIFATDATLAFSRQFFPGTRSPLDGIIETFITYAVGFAARPLGGVVFGHFGDKYGNWRFMQLSIILIGSATFAPLPTSQQVGYCASTMLVVLRFI